MNKVYLNYTYTDSNGITLFRYDCKMYNKVYNITGNVRLGYLTRIVYNGVLYENCN